MNAAELPLDLIAVENRHRKDLGDLEALAQSIGTVGLMHPVVVTPEGQLVAGQRRLEAARLLGWERVPVTVMADLVDAAWLLRAETDENTCRKPFTPTEAEAVATKIEAVLKPLAQARRKEAIGRSRRDAAKFAGSQQPEHETRQIAAQHAGLSHATIAKVRQVKQAAEDPEAPQAVRATAGRALESMDEDGNVHAAWKSVVEAKTAQLPASGETEGQPKWEPKLTRRRKPITEAARANLDSIDDCVNRIEKLLTDDRYRPNRAELDRLHRARLAGFIARAQQVLDQLGAAEDFPQQEEPSTPTQDRNPSR